MTCRCLAEADFPLSVVSNHAAGEKYAGKGYPNTVHLWWARRPYGACRAVLLSLLLPDPCSPGCPEDFKAVAAKVLSRVLGQVASDDESLQSALLKFVGTFSDWKLTNQTAYLDVARSLVRAAHPEQTPFVTDPFAGGGAIPLEALRLGCDALASDLNPVACTAMRVLLDDIPRGGREIGASLREIGDEIEGAITAQLATYYPRLETQAQPIAYIWARTVRCEAPNCGAEIPVFRSPWLSKRGSTNAKYFMEDDEGTCTVLIVEDAPVGGPVQLRIANGIGSERHRKGFAKPIGTKVPGNNAHVQCPCCGTVLSGSRANPRVQAQLVEQRGGVRISFDKNGIRNGGATLLAVVETTRGRTGRSYRLPEEIDYQALWEAQQRVDRHDAESAVVGQHGDARLPTESLPPIGTLGFRVQRYGVATWSDLFSHRQLLALTTIIDALRDYDAGDEAMNRLLTCAFSRVAMSNMSCTRWNPSSEKMQHTFGRQALPMVWDFAETVPIAQAPGNWRSGYELVADVAEQWSGGTSIGQVEIADAAESPLSSSSADIWFTDPPYYDAVPYADLSDFFYVWMKRALPGETLLHDPYNSDNPLTPKDREIVQDVSKTVDGTIKDSSFFEHRIEAAFREGRRVLKNRGVGCVVFAHKTTEGWEALLGGLVRAGWTITASWPIATELGTRLRAQGSAALATSVHLICRPRPEDAGIGDWGDVLRSVPIRVSTWMERLQSEGVRGADLVFACIGPALEIFSKYERVETAEGAEVGLGEFLERVWEAVGKSALSQVLGDSQGTTVLEEDARLTALFLWTLQTTKPENGDDTEDQGEAAALTGGFNLIFDVVRRFAQPLGIHLPEWEDRIIKIEKGVVRLLPVADRAKRLFGDEGVAVAAAGLSGQGGGTPQLRLFPDAEDEPLPRRRGKKTKVDISGEALAARREATTLDRVHAAMLLQRGGQANALRTLLEQERERGPEFMRLANALAALYPRGSEELRLLEAMLVAAPK